MSENTPLHFFQVALRSPAPRETLHAEAIDALSHIAHIDRDYGMTTMSPSPAAADALASDGQEHVILLAVSVTAPDRARAERWLHTMAPRPYAMYGADGTHVDSWWVAEDDRRDGSDCESAVFIPGDRGNGITQSEARRLLVERTEGLESASREHGTEWMVRIEYNTDHDGRWIDPETEAYPETLHVGFHTKAEAFAWMDARTDGDKDVHDAFALMVNRARPASRDAEELAELRAAVRAIEAAWDGGDLAGAVRDAAALVPAADAEDDAEVPAEVAEEHVEVADFALTWVPADTDEPGDQRADDPNPHGFGFYEVGPDSPGWSAALVLGTGSDVITLGRRLSSEEEAKTRCVEHANGAPVPF